jgi:hypothetical protein
VRAVALHKCLLFVANQILELCWKIAGVKFPVSNSPRACSIDYTIAMCYRVLEEVNEADASSTDESLKTQLENVVKQLLPEPTTDKTVHISAHQEAVPDINKQTSCFTSNRVHDEIEHEAVVPAAGRQEHNALVTRGFKLIREYGQKWQRLHTVARCTRSRTVINRHTCPEQVEAVEVACCDVQGRSAH